jgi:protein TonB
LSGLDFSAASASRAGDGGDLRLRRYALILVTAVHGAALAMIWQASADREDMGAPRLLTVSWVSAEAAPTPASVPEPLPRPAAARPRPKQASSPVQLAAADPQPSAAESVPPAVAPSSAEPAADAGPAAAMRVAPAPAFAPPRFEADYLSNPAPAYPSVSRARGEQGKVMLRVLVTAGGEPGEVLVHRSSGFDPLDRAALDAVRRWKFVPARLGEEAVTAWVQVPISFTLRR